MKRSRAFTLIELLVVIAIIGVLSAVVLSSLNTARIKSRDATRMAAVRQIQNALQLYYNDNGGTYPLMNTASGIETLAPFLVPTYISAINFDNSNVSGAVYYRPASNPSSYLIYVSLEHQTQVSPSAYGCRTGQGPVVQSGLYSSAPEC